jgi:hypothetical protein
MAENELPVTEDVYAAIMDLQERLQEAYGRDVNVSDTIDFLGHQFFVLKMLLDIELLQVERMAEERVEPSLLDKLLGLMGLSMPKDPACFVRADVGVPLHWMSTRWLREIEGKNLLKCLSGLKESEPREESKAKGNERRIEIL